MGGESGNNDEAGQRPAQADREAVLTAPQNNKHMEDKCSLEFLNFKVFDETLELAL